MKNKAQFRPYTVCDIIVSVKIVNHGREAPAVGRNGFKTPVVSIL
jgi:hypothetical protein